MTHFPLKFLIVMSAGAAMMISVVCELWGFVCFRVKVGLMVGCFIECKGEAYAHCLLRSCLNDDEFWLDYRGCCPSRSCSERWTLLPTRLNTIKPCGDHSRSRLSSRHQVHQWKWPKQWEDLGTNSHQTLDAYHQEVIDLRIWVCKNATADA